MSKNLTLQFTFITKNVNLKDILKVSFKSLMEAEEDYWEIYKIWLEEGMPIEIVNASSSYIKRLEQILKESNISFSVLPDGNGLSVGPTFSDEINKIMSLIDDKDAA